MYFMGKWPEVQQACEPDQIYWDNLGYRGANRLLRHVFIWFITMTIIMFTIYAITIMSNVLQKLNNHINTDGICTGKTFTAKQAYQDYTIRNDDEGKMNCFCSEMLRDNL